MVLEDGECVGEYTLKRFIKDVQAAIGAEVDGIAGNETISKTVTVSMTKNRKHAVVKPIQRRLNYLGCDCGTVDGVAGLKFRAAVIAFQKANGCTADGEITAKNKTWKKLLCML
jgi:peptidoglycan hydrolase-like protein with peptidoglycan-binding domain